MATPSFKIEIDYDNKTCTVTDLDPQGTSAMLDVEGSITFHEQYTINIGAGDTSVTFDMPTVNGDIEEATYIFIYTNEYYNPTDETQKQFAWVNPTIPSITIVKSHSCELLTYHTEDSTDYDISGYTTAFTRTITLTPPPLSGIDPVTVSDTQASPVGEIDTEGGILTGIFETEVTTNLTYSKTDYSFLTVVTSSVLDDITCALHGTETVDAMETLVQEWYEATISNYALAQTKLALLNKVMAEQMLYQEYLKIGNLTKAAEHSDNIKTLLNVDDE